MVPDIAAGDALGSRVCNLAIIALENLIHREQTALAMADQEHVLSAGFGVVLIGAAGLGLLAAGIGDTTPIFHIGWPTPVLLLLYLVAVRTNSAK